MTKPLSNKRRGEFERLGQKEVERLVLVDSTLSDFKEDAWGWLSEQNLARTAQEKEHRENERTIARWTRTLGRFTVVLAATSALTALILYWTDQTSRLRDRAFISFGDPPQEPYPPAPASPTIWAAGITVANTGNMPARRVTIRYACPDAPAGEEVADTFGLASSTEWKSAQIGSVIVPRQGATLQGCAIPIEVYNDAKNSRRQLFYIVEARYMDGFDLDTVRVTQMSRYFAFDPWGGRSLGFTKTHNCTDDDCRIIRPWHRGH
ncbi:MAG: hypothetical protein WCA56_02460 [Xanthobacteraceae bacterium]